MHARKNKEGGNQMRDNDLLFDRSCHVLYSKPCTKEIRAKIALHYPEAERETVWEKVQRQYAVFLSDWRTDLGGKKNFHNGVGGTYDCIAIMSYYTVCKAVTSFREIEEMEENLILPTFRKLKFVDCNKPFWRKLMYKAFVPNPVKSSQVSAFKPFPAFSSRKRQSTVAVNPFLIVRITFQLFIVLIFKLSEITFCQLFNNMYRLSRKKNLCCLHASFQRTYINRLNLWIIHLMQKLCSLLT